MLQQTQVPTVIPYYARFLEDFPTVDALAAAPLDRVLAHWQGLGYYARARNLHAAARIVVEQHEGQVPRGRAAIRALPGIGPYIAAAVLSIAYGQDEAAIDTNIARVLCRLYDYGGDLTRAEGKRALQAYAEALLPPGRAGEFNTAIMELGATVCVARSPRCDECPVREDCLAHLRGTEELRPHRPAKRPTPYRTLAAAYCLRQAPENEPPRLLVVRRVPAGLLGGMWELPTAEVGAVETPGEALRRALGEHLGVEARAGEPLARVEHGYSHFRVGVDLCPCDLTGEPHPTGPWDAARWITPAERPSLGLTGVAVKSLAALGWGEE
ncbi:MAG: A/G-specific adenine glycosylase [Chloroflexi bacterium]|nr:A/G-specific adenine glycosylase [Chloroflexota bacterium]